ncbi:hypothetical protein OG552_21425 [Streptomyces sp. NBC_01476]|uniref:hypothetical protein n=1 Tax=Streptomyces sp. NBC_01476 TaxID=2903881 RepID=UPI002E30BB1A|nr:hypothetical protein [Streptomyces sp. NBC_01476]
MTPDNRNGSAGTHPVTIPADLRGPFFDEIMPDGPYKHRGAQLAAVAFYRNGGHSVITVQGAKSHNKPVIGRPTSICRIVRGEYQTSFQMELPTYGDQATFLCAVDINWEVRDFHRVAEKRVVDVEKMLRPPLLARLRAVTRQHGLSGAQAADEAIQAELAGGSWSSFGADIGLATKVFVRIDLGRAATDHNLAVVRVQHDATVQTALDQAAAARVQANLPAARALIQSGEAEQYATLVAQNPGGAADLLGALQAQAREQRKGALEYLSHLIDQGVVQRHQVEGPVQMLIDYARATGGAVFEGGLPQPPTSLPAPPTPQSPTAPVPPRATPPPPSPPTSTVVLHPEDSRPTPPAAGPPPPPPAPPAPPAPPRETTPSPAAGKVDYVRRRPRGNGPGQRPADGG